MISQQNLVFRNKSKGSELESGVWFGTSKGDMGPCGGGDLSCSAEGITIWRSSTAGPVDEGGGWGGGGSELVVHWV